MATAGSICANLFASLINGGTINQTANHTEVTKAATTTRAAMPELTSKRLYLMRHKAKCAGLSTMTKTPETAK